MFNQQQLMAEYLIKRNCQNDKKGTNKLEITGETKKTYMLAKADDKKYIAVKISGITEYNTECNVEPN